jgi:phosphomannomutase
MNAGNGCAGIVLPELFKHLPMIEPIKIFWEPDGSFPNGIPNPLLPERRADTEKSVLDHKADLGVAWDGDFDRCFFYDNKGVFVEGYYLVALFGDFFVKKVPGSKIIHDPRLVWATIDVIKAAGGIPIETKAGHAFIKERMRSEDAIYAGEMSAHHYFRDNFYADNGMIPMLVLFEILGETGKSLHQLVEEWMKKYPVSGEINITVSDADKVIAALKEMYAKAAVKVSEVDGVSINFEQWRFNIRKSNTEPVIRLNIESRNDTKLMEQKRDELVSLIKSI